MARGVVGAFWAGRALTVTINASLYFSDPDGDVLTYDATSTGIAVAVPSVSGNTLRRPLPPQAAMCSAILRARPFPPLVGYMFE